VTVTTGVFLYGKEYKAAKWYPRVDPSGTRKEDFTVMCLEV
jgi:hypothetical protein